MNFSPEQLAALAALAALGATVGALAELKPSVFRQPGRFFRPTKKVD